MLLLLINKLSKMIVEKIILLLLASLPLLIAGHDQLLKIGEKHSCIKQVIAVFVANRNCNMLDDAAKSNLALKMTECLLQQMGKALPAECERPSGQLCKLEGDSWSTFSTFFAHIDNLCHFYWEMLHHERAEVLIDELSQSSQNAELLLKKNALETEKILMMQQSMHGSLEESLSNQKEMARLINSSARHISNLSLQMQSFVKRIHEEISQNYGSVRNVLNAMNAGLSQALSIQSYMTAELSSIRGTLYFLSHFLLLLFVTSFRKYSQARLGCLAILGVNLLLELSVGCFIDNFMGTHRFRYLFILLELILICHTDTKKNEFQEAISLHLNTPRLKNVFRRAIIENEAITHHLHCLCSPQDRECRKMEKAKQIGGFRQALSQ